MAPIEHNCSDWDWRLNNINTYFSLNIYIVSCFIQNKILLGLILAIKI